MREGELVAGRFRLEARVGSGGMGVVHRALDELTGRRVAVKLFAWRNAEEVQRAHREVQVLAQLRHPAIVAHIADGVTEAGDLYLAMEWVDGCTIAERLESDGFTVREAFAVVRPIAGALEAAHQAGVLHRDLKPTNIMLAGRDPSQARLIDFGIARASFAVTALTRTGMAIGTPGYMAPEQARGHRTLTPAVDVFGLGCVLYECLAGQPAFSGTAAAAVMTKILLAPPAPLRELCPELPEPAAELVDRMLAKDLESRLPACALVLAELDRLAALPDGPRRGTRSLSQSTRRLGPAAPEVHVIVGAAQGSPGDVLDLPTPDAIPQLQAAAAAASATLEILATGAVVAHLRGEPGPTTVRAAQLALAMRAILPGWGLAISSPAAEVRDVVDAGTLLLTSAGLASLFRKRGEPAAIVVDARAARYLREEFDVTAGAEPRLLGRKR